MQGIVCAMSIIIILVFSIVSQLRIVTLPEHMLLLVSCMWVYKSLLCVCLFPRTGLLLSGGFRLRTTEPTSARPAPIRHVPLLFIWQSTVKCAFVSPCSFIRFALSSSLLLLLSHFEKKILFNCCHYLCDMVKIIEGGKTLYKGSGDFSAKALLV